MIKVLIIGTDTQAAEVVGLSIGRRWPDAVIGGGKVDHAGGRLLTNGD